MKQNKLFVTIGNGVKSYQFVPKQDRKVWEKLKRIDLSSATCTSDCEVLTDYFGAYIDREAPRFVSRALRTIYANQWTEKDGSSRKRSPVISMIICPEKKNTPSSSGAVTCPITAGRRQRWVS